MQLMTVVRGKPQKCVFCLIDCDQNCKGVKINQHFNFIFICEFDITFEN